MRIKNIITFLLLLISTNSSSEGKWLSNGNTMINLNNFKFIQQGYNIGGLLHDEHTAYGGAVYEFYNSDINKINSPIKRCLNDTYTVFIALNDGLMSDYDKSTPPIKRGLNGTYTMTYKEWVAKAKARDMSDIHTGNYLWDYSPIKDVNIMNAKIISNLGYSLRESEDMKRYIGSLGIPPATNDERFELYNDITSYATFHNRYLYKNPPLSKYKQMLLKYKTLFMLSDMPMNSSKRKKTYEAEVEEKIKEIDKIINSFLPVSKHEYEMWLADNENDQNEDYKNTIIEETYNLKDHYLSNTVPMYHNSIKLDDFELTLSGASCDLNLVSSESESEKLVQDTLSRIVNFINSDKHYMELF